MTPKGPSGSVVAWMAVSVQAAAKVVEFKAQKIPQNSEHMAMRCNRKSLWMPTVALWSCFYEV